MTKEQLETLIDSRWKSSLRPVEEKITELERRVAWTERKLAEPES